jgi:hypothetical protein
MVKNPGTDKWAVVCPGKRLFTTGSTSVTQWTGFLRLKKREAV